MHRLPRPPLDGHRRAKQRRPSDRLWASEATPSFDGYRRAKRRRPSDGHMETKNPASAGCFHQILYNFGCRATHTAYKRIRPRWQDCSTRPMNSTSSCGPSSGAFFAFLAM